ncbi:glycosyltransferase involved in cell wall biosynthesis [Zhongshania antarctica]|jgi:glycosyltransferase involved in cell wall biosynthesis|uniref:Glycosyltransferase involved in cell wall biosynthesis n=1 Tax=Zhongshania antarctica TaxID=641702 RepID=A0A840R271_9GAMM|nr:glycosyltransferase family 4 protein [Zhongshania antarctica]MBB5186646.1 glycosyltransferase involved in cell wall biosynthesis [Zhongshania antarctica]
MASTPTAATSTKPAFKAKVIPLDDARPRRALKVCLLGYRSAPYGGGQGIYLKYLSKALVEAGHTVDVISGQPYPHLDPRVNLIKMPGMNLFETGLGSIRPHHLRSMTNIIEWSGKLTGAFSEPYCFGRRVVKYLKNHGRHYDIIHDNQCLSYGMLELQKRNFPFITTIHHPITSDLSIALKAAKNWRERLLIRRWHSFLIMQRQVARQLHHVVTVSERSRQDIAVAFDMQPAGISVVLNGIDTEEFRPLPNTVKNPNRVMAAVSSDQPLKGMRYLLEGVAKVLPKYPDLELLLVGQPKEGGESSALINDLGLSKHIRCVSGISTEDLVGFYNEASVVIVPSVYEGFGLPAGEAMACGTAVISTDGGALPEVVGDAAIQVPVRDSSAIAEALDALLASPAKREQLAAAGRQRIEELFCWRRAAQQMTNYYWQVLQRENS